MARTSRTATRKPPSGPYERRLEEAFEAAGWSVQPAEGPAAFSVGRKGKRFPVLLRQAPEARRPITSALIADAILRGRATLRGEFVVVVALPSISQSMAQSIERYVEEVAPKQAFGYVDSRGLVRFHGLGLEGVRSEPSVARATRDAAQRPRDLFSDLNQWMLKILVGGALPAGLLSVPREPVRSAADLATRAGVSVPVAWRLSSALKEAGYLDDESNLSMVRELMGRWRAAAQRPKQRLGARWILPGRSPLDRLRENLAAHRRGAEPLSACLGLFAACDALGLGHVRGAPVHVYVRHLDRGLLESLGLAIVEDGGEGDLFVQVARWPEALFRAAVDVDGAPVSDVLQCWLDVSDEPHRGPEQAAFLWRRAIGPVVAKGEPEP